MKRYIFITPTLQNMGGAQSYIRAKMRWLRENGWQVDVIFAIPGKAVIPELQKCSLCFQETKYPTFYYRARERKRIVNKLCSAVLDKQYDEVIIESTVIENSTWGECIASKIGAKQLLYTLQEDNTTPNKSLQEYLLFKHSRKEMAGIVETSLYDCFSTFHPITRDLSYCLKAYQFYPVEDYEYNLVDVISKEKHDFVIGSLCRLNKPCIRAIFDEVLSYIKEHSNYRFILLLIGDSPEGDDTRSYIEKMCSKVLNLKLYITGYLFPVPKKLLALVDAGYSTSGSVRIMANEGIPTVAVDGNDYKPIGVMGYDTDNSLFRESEPIIEIKKYFDRILFEKSIEKKSPKKPTQPDYSSHFEFLSNSAASKTYFNVSKLCWNKDQRLQRILMPILGPKAYHKIMSLIK